MKRFQTIVLIVFGTLGVLGALVFALQRATGDPEDRIPELTVWGTLPAEYFSFLRSPALEDPYLDNISYKEIREENFDRELVEAIADGYPSTGPDIVLLSGSKLYKHKSKLQMISYSHYPASEYTESFLPIAELFRFDEGIAALPAVVDPMVMYWNEPFLTSRGYVAPPTYWDEMRGFSEQMTETEGFLTIEKSGVSLGTFDNIDHAKDLISLLLMQSGSPIVAKRGNAFQADFSQTMSELSLPPSEALHFYTEFSDPQREAYSWNPSLPSSRNAFLAENLALYFGYASERDALLEANPNLAFNIARMPQVQDSPLTLTHGKVYGFAALKASDTPGYAYQALWSLSKSDTISRIDDASGLPSIYRRFAVEDPEDPASHTLVRSAIAARTWLDPDDIQTQDAFRELITSVRSNERAPSAALGRLRARINALLR